MAKKDFKEIISELGFGDFKIPEKENGFENNFIENSAPIKTEEKAEIAIEDLRNKYSQKTRAEFENKAQKLQKERDDALRENWILQQRAEAALPEQLAASGMNGGATETTLANLLARFQGNRNDIRSGYMDNLGDLAAEHSAQQAEAERTYNKEWIEYLLSLAKMEEEFEQKKALAAFEK